MAEMARQSGRQAEGARIKAELTRQQSEDNLEQAPAAVQSLAKFGMELRQTRMQQATSWRILDETLKLNNRLDKSQVNDPRPRQQFASTLVNAVEIHNAFRDTEKATELLQRAVHLNRGRTRAQPVLYRLAEPCVLCDFDVRHDNGRGCSPVVVTQIADRWNHSAL